MAPSSQQFVPLRLLITLALPLLPASLCCARRAAAGSQLFLRTRQPACTISSPFPSPDLPDVGNEAGEYQTSSWPLRTMVFIDGSWLYYSFHGRRSNCPVTRAYGEGWEYEYSIDYDRLPQLISQQLHRELLDRFASRRFVEVVRTVVFSSMRADTDRFSPRVKMFEDMQRANFDVHLSTTVGHQEKCIDIALAVEMMHYASLPGAYDVAVLITGDKDFIPALSRIRTKGKRVALCSMRNCCSQDLLDPSAHVRDFAPVWLDDHINYLVRPNADTLAVGEAPFAASEILRLVVAFLQEQGGTASSRDIGRFLQGSRSDGQSQDMLSKLKRRHSGLRAFLAIFPDKFEIAQEEAVEGQRPSEFFVSLLDMAARPDKQQEELLIDAKIGSANVRARESAMGPAQADAAASSRGALDVAAVGWQSSKGTETDGPGTDEQAESWETRSVPDLRAELRRRGLAATGRKSELLERLQALPPSAPRDSRPQSIHSTTPPPRIPPLAQPIAGRTAGAVGGPMAIGLVPSQEAAARTGSGSDVGVQVQASAGGSGSDAGEVALQGAVVAYLESKDGSASSRDIGRYLAARGQLQELKNRYSGLFHFLQRHDRLFRIELPTESNALEYRVHLCQSASAADDDASSQ